MGKNAVHSFVELSVTQLATLLLSLASFEGTFFTNSFATPKYLCWFQLELLDV